jgi:hypothetical protein
MAAHPQERPWTCTIFTGTVASLTPVYREMREYTRKVT